jgi:pilus assembly protein CpaC
MAQKTKPAEASSRPLAPGAGHGRRPRRSWWLIVPLVFAGHTGLACGAPAKEVAAQVPVVVEVDKAVMIELAEPANSVLVANPEVADVQVPRTHGATKFAIFGKKAGSTTVFVLGQSGQLTGYAVTVPRQVSEIAAALKKEVPTATVDVSSAPNGVTVSGTAASPLDAQRLKATARQFLGDKDSLDFNVVVAAATQVNLRVRVAEVSRSADKQFGLNWSAISNNGNIAFGLLTGRAPLATVTNAVTGASTSTFGNFSPSPNNFDSVGVGYQSKGGSVNASGLIDALEQEGLITVLAEPNLTAASGETASFLAGGEFPVPVPQGLQQITIEWKKFGVSVDFTPTVLDANRLSIRVRPEVSELTATGSVVINGTTIPGLAVRRAETTVELASGQSFAIAGLFQNNTSNQVQQLPWLGNIPVLGTLFRSSSFQRNESELVIIVTPYVVEPVAHTSDLHLPTEDVVFASDLEQILLGRLTSGRPPAGTSAPPATSTSPSQTPPAHLTGPAGFMLEH